MQFDKKLEMNSNIFRPFFFNKSDTFNFSINYKLEFYLNNSAPNQENMDVRYFSKGYSNFNSLQLVFDSKFFDMVFEPYIKNDNFYYVESVIRNGTFKNLNDRVLTKNEIFRDKHVRNLLIFPNFKGFGIGYHFGNRWWGPGFHSSLQMTNNSWPFGSYIIGTMNELRFGKIGLSALYSFSSLSDKYNPIKKFHTALNGKISWYGSLLISAGFSRNYLSGGDKSVSGKIWTEQNAQLLVFEGLLTSNLINKEYTIGGHDKWDQTISGYFSIVDFNKRLKLYAEIGFNDNRMYLADLISQPDHTMATIIGIRDYGNSKRANGSNFIYGFEWTNLMITYTIRHRGLPGTPEWYNRPLYDYSSNNSRRWGAHSGSDSDDWLFYFGYLSNKILIMPAFNYERHGIVSHRPAEVKFEFRLDIKYNYLNSWFGVYFEIQKDMFLGFPDYFYEDKFGNPIDSSEGKIANSRNTSTLILSFNRFINF